VALSAVPHRHRFPVSIISQVVWIYQRFNNSYLDIEEQMAFWGISVSHETVRSWSVKFSSHFRYFIRKRERNPSDKWHLDEMNVRVNDKTFILWRSVDSDEYELDILLQTHPNKKAAIRFLSRLLGLLGVFN
jgi:putative transposase